MTKLRVLFNSVETIDTTDVFARLKSLGIRDVSMFCDLDAPCLPPHFEKASREFDRVFVNVMHRSAFVNEEGWRRKLKDDCADKLAGMASLGINDYAFMIECNLYGLRWHPSLKGYVSRDRLVDTFNTFYSCAHEVNPDANVILVPYPNPLMNLSCGIRGWKDWWVRYGERMKFDRVALDSHVGVWIFAPTRRSAARRLASAAGFLIERGHPPLYVEVGYPTTGIKPLLGLFGWGREKDQVRLLDACLESLSLAGVEWMQICECIDPATDRVYDTLLLGDRGMIPRAFGLVPVIEEKHWGLFNSNGSEKAACEWVRGTGGIRQAPRPRR